MNSTIVQSDTFVMHFSNFSKINTLRLVLVSSRNFCFRYAYKLFDFNICDEKLYDMPMLYKLSILLPETLSIFKWKNESYCDEKTKYK